MRPLPDSIRKIGRRRARIEVAATVTGNATRTRNEQADFHKAGSQPMQELWKEKFMNKTRCEISRTGFVLCAAILGVLTGSIYAQPGPAGAFAPPPVVEASVSVGLPGMEIRVESDF